VNAVFLVALCLSIFLEAIERFFSPQVVSNPKLVLIVGSCGLLSNILGLFLFHDHGHSHGGGGDSHESEDTLRTVEEGVGDLLGDNANAAADENGNVAGVLPESVVHAWAEPGSNLRKETSGNSKNQLKASTREFSKSDEENSTARSESPVSSRKRSGSEVHKRHRRHTSGSFSRGFGSVDNLHIHPASFRNDIIAAGRIEEVESAEFESEEEEAIEDMDGKPTEDSPLVRHIASNGSAKHRRSMSHTKKNKGKDQEHRHDSWHTGHNHAQPKTEGGHGHSHGDLNMRGVFLHVMGDALGNIGVIASALFIWLTSFSWKYYVDPAVSLVITFIILASAIPLCKAASRILLQAVPPGMSVDDIKEDIEQLPGVLSCHHLHVWQLSDTKLVASLHIQVECDVRNEGSERYMHLARQVRRCLHEYGIHSSTIQPEFCSESDLDPSQTPPRSSDGLPSPGLNIDKPKASSKLPSRAGSMRSDPGACLLDCGDECARKNQCCPAKKGVIRLEDDHHH
jgi:zinc transporter 1